MARYQQFFGIRGTDRPHWRATAADGGRQAASCGTPPARANRFTHGLLTKALVQHDSLKACRVVVVTDRLDLEDQLARNFMAAVPPGSALATRKEGEKAKVGSGRELAKRIGRGTERIIFTLIHKFATASKLPECHKPLAQPDRAGGRRPPKPRRRNPRTHAPGTAPRGLRGLHRYTAVEEERPPTSSARSCMPTRCNVQSKTARFRRCCTKSGCRN